MRKQKTASRPAPTVAGDPQKTAGWPRKVSVHLALILCLGLLAYANSFGVPFTFDDNSSIVDNPVIRNLSDFLSGAGYTYNPRRFVGYLTIALNHHFGGLEVAGYHAVNLAIHLANALLFYLIARVTLTTPFFRGDEPAPDAAPALHALVPLFASLLFVVHPVQTQAVTYVIQRLASLATLFYLAALFCYIKARLALAGGTPHTDRTPPFPPAVAGWFTLSLACTVLAMRTKEITATLPLAVMLYEFSFFGAEKKKRLLLLAPILLTLLIVPIGLLASGEPIGALLSDVSALTRETVEITRGEYLLTQFSVIATYLRLLLLPVGQNLDYDYPVYHSLLTPRVLSSFVLLALLALLAAWLYRTSGSGGEADAPVPSRRLRDRLVLPDPVRRVERDSDPRRDLRAPALPPKHRVLPLFCCGRCTRGAGRPGAGRGGRRLRHRPFACRRHLRTQRRMGGRAAAVA